MTKRRPRPSFILWVVSYLALVWAWLVHVTDRVLLLLTPTPKSAVSDRALSGGGPAHKDSEKEK